MSILYQTFAHFPQSRQLIGRRTENGYTLITGTNQGIHAYVKPHPTKLIVRSFLEDGSKEAIELPMEADLLLAEAQKDNFFSYTAGVAYQVLTHYRVRGLVIENYKMDLPLKKGLSSSAAICVLVARAFNRIYDLKMTTRGEMEFAYLGEITTSSRCGRMDQGCAYGSRPIMMTFDGDRLDVKEVGVANDMYFVIVDLCASKDTVRILSRLNTCYPFAEDKMEQNVQKCLGPVNDEITHKAYEALCAGDAKEVGKLMIKAQKEFDELVVPCCPSELDAPELHKVLDYEPIQKYVLGGKGVGSQGDGSAQFIVKDEASQAKVIEIVEGELKKPCLKLTVASARSVRKAVIPAAGFGTRLFPASKAIKKELFPLIDTDGRAKPVIMAIVEEAVQAGIEEVCIIVQKGDKELFDEFFGMPPRIENYNKLSKEDKEYCDYLLELGRKITFVTQDTQDGFGHAVYSAKEWVGDEPFMLLLGDHLYATSSDIRCSRQILDVYESSGMSVLGLMETSGEEIKTVGCVTGEWSKDGEVLTVSQFYEKPDKEYAKKHMHVDGMAENKFLGVFGIYVLNPLIFEYLEEHIENNIREKGEFQLTSCLDRVRQEKGFAGCVVKGRRFDIGRPDTYLQTLVDFRNG